MYLNYFGFTEEPFNITPDPRFLFFSKRHREAYDHLLYGIKNRKGFIELTGEVGCGKTTICRAVLAGLPSEVASALVLNPCLTETQLLRAILHDFGLGVRGRDRLSCVQSLNSFLLDQLAKGNNVALIIDEAQDLTDEVLEQVRLLSNLETDQDKLLQIVLCGQPELKTRLAASGMRQLRQRITVRCHLYPLSELEVCQYIESRLRTAGQRDGSLFDAGAVARIYKYSKGVPRLINAVCDVALLAGYAANTTRIDRRCVASAIKQLEGSS